MTFLFSSICFFIFGLECLLFIHPVHSRLSEYYINSTTKSNEHENIIPELSESVKVGTNLSSLEQIKIELYKVEYISSNPKLREDIMNLILNKSNSKDRPEGKNNGTGPVLITVTTFIQNIDQIDDAKMQYTVRFIYRQSWIDKRLIYGEKQEFNKTRFLQLDDDEISKIWTPDLYFSNEKEGTIHSLLKSNSFTRIYPHGLVLQSIRVSLTLACRMGLYTFPLDIQHCPIRINSYGWLKAEVDVQWKTKNAVEMRKRDLMMPNFELGQLLPATCTSVTQTGEYSCILLWFTFHRKMALYFILLYIPSALLVFVSWASFWVEPETGQDARISLGVGALLTLVTQTYVATKDAPHTSYIKASDLWTGFCQFLVFLAFLEQPLVNYLIKRGNRLEQSNYKLENRVQFVLNTMKIIDKIMCGLLRILHLVWFLITLPLVGLQYINSLLQRFCVRCESNSKNKITNENENKAEKLLKPTSLDKSNTEITISQDTDTVCQLQGQLLDKSNLETTTISQDTVDQPQEQQLVEKTSRQKKAIKLARNVDNMAKKFFPFIFISFNCFYWAFYLIAKDYRTS